MGKIETILGYFLLPFLAFTLGYFQYDGFSGGLAVLLYHILTLFAGLLGFIPVVGVILYLLVAKFTITPWLLNFTGITDSWVISIFYWIGFLEACLTTIVSVILIIKFLEEL